MWQGLTGTPLRRTAKIGKGAYGSGVNLSSELAPEQGFEP